ncbi:hypothetical protein CQW23_28325 [Capsicum baccatum]|uniref:Uncharacterized protein n=1 Tax=Capsicum baccatum TaxID=33114 RepID=A0A2G2VGB3_CAPBA|nr:hypothetical protein CQW23_28325 [Capsicum baccatum]
MDVPKSSKETSRYKKKKFSEDRKSKRIEKKTKRKKSYKSREEKKKSKKTNACYRYGRVGHFAKDYKVKSKIKSRTLDEEIKDSFGKILLNASLENTSLDYTDNEENHSTEEDLRALHNENHISSKDKCLPCQQEQPREDEEDENILYNIISQF